MAIAPHQEQDLADLRAFLATHNVSSDNTRAVLSVVTRLVKGQGLCLPHAKEASFLVDAPIGRLRECDVDTLKRQAEAWLPLKADKGHGWKWNHPLNWIAKFQGQVAVKAQAKQPKEPRVRSKKPKKAANDDDVGTMMAALKRKRDEEAEEIQALEARLTEKRVKLARVEKQLEHLAAMPGATKETEATEAAEAPTAPEAAA